jgi:hypothetical protein
MDKETASRRMVYTATAIAIGVAALWALLFVPRLAAHPEAIAERVDHSSKIFFAIQLVAVVVLLAVVILSRRGVRMLSGPLYLGALLLFLHDFMVFQLAVYSLQFYEGFQAEAILMLVCIGANLIAAILAIISGKKYLQLAKAQRGEKDILK